MKIEEGKYYWTRGGDILGPAMPFCSVDERFAFHLRDWGGVCYPFMPDGRFCGGKSLRDFDLVAEWTGDPERHPETPPHDLPQYPPMTIQRARIEALRLYLENGGRDYTFASEMVNVEEMARFIMDGLGHD